jgi:hypothetical protein
MPVHLLIALTFFLAAPVSARAADSEAAAVLELGGSVGRSLDGSAASSGPTLAVEVTPLEKYLELEAGVTRTFSRNSSEWDVDLLFKKPWKLSRKVEFMIGGGPAWVRIRENGVTRNAVAGEIALDFMFWPSSSRRFGWYVEPAYEYSFGAGHEKAISVSAGLLIALGREP